MLRTIELTPEQEERILQEALAVGMDKESYWQSLVNGLSMESANVRHLVFLSYFANEVELAGMADLITELLKHSPRTPVSTVSEENQLLLRGFGKYKNVNTSSDVFAARKAEEKERENRRSA